MDVIEDDTGRVGYDDNSLCSRLATDEDYMDFIIENNAPIYDESAIGCMVKADENWSVGYGELPKGLSMSVADLNYHTIPKLYAAAGGDYYEMSGFAASNLSNQGLDALGFDVSGISSVLAQPNLNARGQGVIIGIIGDGIDYRSLELKYSPVVSRITYVWEQNAKRMQNFADVPEVPYGAVYTNEDINRALAAYEEGLDAKDYVPVNDYGGYCSDMARVAAASAPEAELAVVNLKPAKEFLRRYFFIQDNKKVYEETDIMLGVRFLLDVAKQRKKPLVIFLPLASGSGPRTGATPLSRVLANAASRTNVAVVTDVGSEADSRAHFSGYFTAGNPAYSDTGASSQSESFTGFAGGNRIFGENAAQTIPYGSGEMCVCELYVGSGSEGVVMELWAQNMDVLSVGFVSPSGETVARIPAGERTSYSHSFVLEKTRVTVDYQVVEELSGLELIFIKMFNPTQGIWRINVYNSLAQVRGRFNIWLNMRKLIDTECYFLRPNPDTTLLMPSADGSVISVGTYNYRTGSDDIDSGRGYNAKDEVKPDIAAPSSGHAAGMAALLFSWGVTDGNDRLMGNNQIKSILTRGAKRDVNTTGAGVYYPNLISGYGRADIMNSFLQLRVN